MQRPYISSPCIDVCRIDQATGWCEGCYRTLDEICMWTRYSEPERQTIMEALPIRRAEAEQRP